MKAQYGKNSVSLSESKGKNRYRLLLLRKTSVCVCIDNRLSTITINTECLCLNPVAHINKGQNTLSKKVGKTQFTHQQMHYLLTWLKVLNLH